MIVNKPYTNKEYADLAVYCNQNNCHIEDKGDYLESVENTESEKERIKREILELKQNLFNADYWGQKYIDGEYTDEEWEVKKAQRKEWRARIKELEAQLDPEKNGENSTADGC